MSSFPSPAGCVSCSHAGVGCVCGHSAALHALTRATALAAEGLSEGRLLALLARCAAEAVRAEIAAVYVQPTLVMSGQPAWILAGHFGGDPEVLVALPRSYGEGGGVLAPLFDNAQELCELDLLEGATTGTVVPKQFPVRSLVGLPVRRRDSRPVGVLLLGALRAHAFDELSLSVLRAIAHLVGIGIDKSRVAAGHQHERRMAADSAVMSGTLLKSVETAVYVGELDGTVRVASGVAHEFNNVLASIVGQTELLELEDLPATTAAAIGAIRRAALDGARMVRNLQGLARPRVETPSTAAVLNETVELNLAQSENLATPLHTQAAQGARAVASAALHGVSILVVDDEPGLVAIVRQFMERSGASVSIALGGKAALVALRAIGSKYDVVITDLDMADVDGWEVAAAARAHQPGSRVVMLTGWAGEIAPEDFESRGVSVVLGKPCSRAELVAAVAALLVARQTPATGCDVLLVDDEPAFARAVRDLLCLQGHRVTIVGSAAAALVALAMHTFDVVLTDYQLGDLTGAELANILADGPSAPFVVLLTGYATQIDDPALLSRGISAVLPKPCRGAELRQIMLRVPTNLSP